MHLIELEQAILQSSGANTADRMLAPFKALSIFTVAL